MVRLNASENNRRIVDPPITSRMIFIYNGLGRNPAWKRSLDGQFLEHYFNRIVARRATAELLALGFDAELLVPEEGGISLAERCRRVNAW